MAWSYVPTDTTSYYWRQTTTLDGVAYLLTFKYLPSEAAYYLDILSADGVTTYVSGVKLVCDYPLLRPYATPPGELLAVSTDATNHDDAAFGELGQGKRVQLVYVDAADVYAANAEPERNPGPFVGGVFVP